MLFLIIHLVALIEISISPVIQTTFIILPILKDGNAIVIFHFEPVCLMTVITCLGVLYLNIFIVVSSIVDVINILSFSPVFTIFVNEISCVF